jgi:hypothetical protein
MLEDGKIWNLCHSEIASLAGARNDEPVVVGMRVGMRGVDA